MITAVFTAWHRIAGVKLYHSLNHALCHPESPPPKKQIWSPTPRCMATPNCCS